MIRSTNTLTVQAAGLLASVAVVAVVACGAAPPPGASIPATPVVIPHELVGRENCTDCHKVAAGKKPLPESHKGRESATCLGCHHAKPS
jgi:hypothetical protein